MRLQDQLQDSVSSVAMARAQCVFNTSPFIEYSFAHRRVIVFFNSARQRLTRPDYLT